MRDIRTFTLLSLALLCGCGDDGDGESSPIDTGTDPVHPEAGANDGGTQHDGSAGNLDGGSAQDGGAGGLDSGTSDGGNGGGGRDSGVEGGMDAAPDAGPSQDAGRDSGAETINGFPVADHCAPGEYNPMFNPFCVDIDGGMESALASGIGTTPSVELSIRWQRLSTAMRANQPYATSVEIDIFQPPASQQLEIWGAMSPCATAGEQSDRLGTVPLNQGTGVYCLDMHPTKPYSHVMLVFRKLTEGNGNGEHGQTYCSMGACPAR